MPGGLLQRVFIVGRDWPNSEYDKEKWGFRAKEQGQRLLNGKLLTLLRKSPKGSFIDKITNQSLLQQARVIRCWRVFGLGMRIFMKLSRILDNAENTSSLNVRDS